MTESQKIELRRSKVRERLGEIGKLSGDTYTDEVKAEERALQDEYTGLEQRHRTAIMAEDKALDDAKGAAGDGDAETRERIELRGRCRVGSILAAALKGRAVTGPEAELQADLGFDANDIPAEIWQRPERRGSAEARAVTGTPSVVGVTMAPVEPYVFAPSIASRLGITEMDPENWTVW